jgi:hypothetical protein
MTRIDKIVYNDDIRSCIGVDYMIMMTFDENYNLYLMIIVLIMMSMMVIAMVMVCRRW